MGSLFSNLAFAECKSVMGTCVKQDMVNSAPHMRSDYVEKTKVTKMPVAASTTENKTANNNKNSAKKINSTGVFSTMQKAGM
jgi:hypothetical protein